MKIKLILHGKTKPESIKNILDIYTKRISSYIPFEIYVIPDLKNTKSLSKEIIKKKEAELTLKAISEKDFIVLLDEKGKTMSSKDFANYIHNHLSYSPHNICFIIGNAYGFDKQVYDKANFLLSLSKMTYSHQIIRICFAEQLYRALTIIHGDPYHNE
ncbi:MAG: 23S rRNA (pseudouridine(1915)-N(3))-methyltransferase RlmH [Marinilabiliales bacterium]